MRVLSLIGEDASPWDMHKVIATNLGLSYTQFPLQHLDSYELFYTNFLHRDVVLSNSDVEKILEWVEIL